MLKYKFLGMIFILILSKLNAQVNDKGNQDKGIVLKPIFQNCLYMDNFNGIKPDTINLDKIANESSFNKNELLTIVFTKSDINTTDDPRAKTISLLPLLDSLDKDKLKDFIINIKEYKPEIKHLSAFCEFTLKYNGKVRIEQTVPNWLCFFINPKYKNIIINEDSVKSCIKKQFNSYFVESFPLVKIGFEKIIIKIINEVLAYSVRAVKDYESRTIILKNINNLIKENKKYKLNVDLKNLEVASLQDLNDYYNKLNNAIEKNKNEEKSNEIKKQNEIAKNKRIADSIQKIKINAINDSIKIICDLLDTAISKTEKDYPKDNLNYRNSKSLIKAIKPSDSSLVIKKKIKECLEMIEDKKSDLTLNFEFLIEKLNAIISGLNESLFKGVSINLNFLQSYFNYNFNNNLLAEKITNGVDKFPDKAENYASISDFNKYKGQYLQTNKIKNNKIFQSGNENFILNHYYVSAIAKLNPTKLFKLKKPIENLLVGAGIGIGFINYKSSVIKSIDINNYTKSSRTRDTAGYNLFKDKISEIYRIDSSSNSYIEEHIFTNSLIYLNLIDLSVQYKIPIKKNKFSIEDVQCNLGFSAGVPISFTSTYYAYYKNNEINPLPNINTNPTLKAGLITNFYVNPILNFKIKNQLIGLGLLISLGSVGLNNESSDAIEKTGIENSLNSFSIKNFGFNIVYHFSKK